MIGFCFETVNWSPYLGHARPELLRMIDAAAAERFGWISLDLPSIAFFTGHGGSISTLRDRLKQRGVGLLAVHSLAITADADVTAALARDAVETCVALEPRYLHAGVVAPVDAAVIEATRRAGRICRDSGIGFAIEFLPFLPVAGIDQTRRLLEAADIRGPGMVIDAWHFFNGPDDWPTLEAVRGDEIAYVQFDDHAALASSDLLHETTQNRVMPGDGLFDLERFARTIEASGFDGVVGIEILSAALRAVPVEQAARRMRASSAPYWHVG